VSLKVQNVYDCVLISGFWSGFEFEDEKRRIARGENEILKEKVNLILKIVCLIFGLSKRKTFKEPNEVDGKDFQKRRLMRKKNVQVS
jgi:hypothetical protein